MWHPDPFVKHPIPATHPPTAAEAARSLWFSPLREAIDPTVEFDRAVDELPRRQLRILDGIIAEIAGPGCSRQAIRRMSISILGQCVYYRYAEKFLKRIDPRLSYGKRTVHALAEHIYRFSLAAINGSKA